MSCPLSVFGRAADSGSASSQLRPFQVQLPAGTSGYSYWVMKMP
ncbi:MAG: hypothetical protein QM723_05810 [Myxococcaceae bacterium]